MTYTFLKSFKSPKRLSKMWMVPIVSFLLVNGCRPVYKASGWNTDNITIARDQYGVPHIFGIKDADVAYGLAWAHAEDNFATIQKTILAGKTMAGREFGYAGAAIDYFGQLLGIRDLATEKYDSTFSPEFKHVLEGYAAGLNDFARIHPNEVLVKKSFPINAVDIASAYIISLASMAGVDRTVNQIMHNKVQVLNEPPTAKGSNAFAFHSSRTNTNESFLVSNSHQPLEGPEAWYEAHLHSEEGWNIIGSLYPGGAMVFHGVNENLGWAHTVNSPDLVDTYQLEINPDNRLEYKVDNQWLTLEEKRIWLHVKVLGGVSLPIPKRIWKSIYGPTILTDRGAFAIHTGVFDNIGAPEQWWRMNKAKNFTEFYSALNRMQLTSFNILYADKYDTIFFASNALLPKREPGFNYTSTVPGNTSKTIWKKYHSFSDLPQQLNPVSGYLFNTNHSPFKASDSNDNLDSASYPKEMNFTLKENNRSLRFREIMPDTGKIDYDKLKEIKYDYSLPKNPAYRTNMNVLFKIDGKQYPDIEYLIDTLQRWNRKSDIDSKGAAVFAFEYYYWKEEIRKSGRNVNTVISEEEAVASLRVAKKYFLHYFHKEVITLGEYQKLVRGTKVYPVGGIDDVMTTIRSQPWKNGMRKATEGESYIMMARFNRNGPIIETINVYGSSNRPRSPHYTDQMELYLNHRLKHMTLNKDEVLKTAKTVYHPE